MDIEEIKSNPKLLNIELKTAIHSTDKLNSLLKLPWLSLLNHNPVFASILQDLVNQIRASNKLNLIKISVSSLLDQLTDPFQPDTQTQTFQIHNQSFQSCSQIRTYTASILKRYKQGQKVTQSHQNFLQALFKYHPTGIQRLENLDYICIATHKSQVVTKCFCIAKLDGSVKEISYIKALNGLMQANQHKSKGENVSRWVSAGQIICQNIKKLVSSTPICSQVLLKAFKETLPHHLTDIQIQVFFFRNILEIIQEQKIIKSVVTTIIRRIIFLDNQQEKLEQLFPLIMNWLQKNQSEETQRMMLSIFNEQVLVSQHTEFVQGVFSAMCQRSEQFKQEFLTVLIQSLYKSKNVENCASYISTFASLFECPLVLVAKYLLYYSLRNPNKNGLLTSKYYMFLVVNKPELIEDSKIKEKTQKLLRKFQQKIPRRRDIDYGVLDDMGIRFESGCYDDFYLPFSQEKIQQWRQWMMEEPSPKKQRHRLMGEQGRDSDCASFETAPFNQDLCES